MKFCTQQQMLNWLFWRFNLLMAANTFVLNLLVFWHICSFCIKSVEARKAETSYPLFSGGARNLFLPGHYRGTTISNGAHLMTCTETAIKHANPGLSSNPCFQFQSLPPIQHAFFVGCADNLRNRRSIRVDSWYWFELKVVFTFKIRIQRHLSACIRHFGYWLIDCGFFSCDLYKYI